MPQFGAVREVHDIRPIELLQLDRASWTTCLVPRRDDASKLLLTLLGGSVARQDAYRHHNRDGHPERVRVATIDRTVYLAYTSSSNHPPSPCSFTNVDFIGAAVSSECLYIGVAVTIVTSSVG